MVYNGAMSCLKTGMGSIMFRPISVGIRRPHLSVTARLHGSGTDVYGHSYSVLGCKISGGIGDSFSREAIQGPIKNNRPSAKTFKINRSARYILIKQTEKQRAVRNSALNFLANRNSTYCEQLQEMVYFVAAPRLRCACGVVGACQLIALDCQ